MALECRKIRVAVEKKLIWRTMICAMYQNTDIMTDAECSTNTKNCKMDNCNKDYKTMASKKEYKSCSDYVCMAEFIQQLQDKVIKDLSKKI